MTVIGQRLLIGICILVMASSVFGAPAQVKTDAPSSAEKGTLLLRDFQPKSMLHAPAHNVERARFPVIDVHNPSQPRLVRYLQDKGALFATETLHAVSARGRSILAAGAIVAGGLDPRDKGAALGFVGATQDLPKYTNQGGMLYVFTLP